MSFNTKLVLPVALGLSIVTVSAFVVYYILKKEEDESRDKSIKTSRVNIIEVSVPKSIVPALIGRNGSNIKEIERKSGAMIHFKKFSDKEYDVCIIRGRTQTAQLAETMVYDFINHQPLIVEDSMVVPGWSCGRIIGTGGETINDISHRSGARVKIEGSRDSDRSLDRTVSFKGTKEQIQLAKSLIENCVTQERCRREIEQSKRSPRHAGPEPEDAGDKHAPYKRTAEPSSSSIEVFVSAVSSPSRFWVQFVGPQVNQLDELVTHMTEYYGNKENRDNHALSSVSVGQVVAAVFRHDGRWYRARVHAITNNEFDATQQVADVFYVDYGDSEYVATRDLCELRADLLRLRFQAMECFLAGVRPSGPEEETVVVSASGHKWDKWSPQAVERFEELTQVARWKALVSRTCTYKKTVTADGEKEKEIPGIKLFDVTDEGLRDVGEALISEGLAQPAPLSPRPSPPPAPFGALGASRVLGMLSEDERAASPPKDKTNSLIKENNNTETDRTTSSLEKSDEPKSVSNFDLSYSEQSHTNGSPDSHDEFLQAERQNLEASTETLVPGAPNLSKTPLDDFKANINRIDSHHSLESLAKHESHK